MPTTKYTKWTPSPLDGLSLEELMDELSEFLLQSGFQYSFRDVSNPHDLDALRVVRDEDDLGQRRDGLVLIELAAAIVCLGARARDLDQQARVDDVAAVKVFHLKNSDPGETADLLSNLFPDDTNQSDASRQLQFGGRGGFPFPFGIRGGGNASSDDPSNRMKKLGRVIAVPDRRTQSLVVTASKDLMPQIEEMIKELDENPANKMRVHIVTLENADPQDVASALQDLFPASTSSRNGSANSSLNTQNPLTQRSTTLLQQQNQQQNSSSTFGGSTGGRSGIP